MNMLLLQEQDFTAPGEVRITGGRAEHIQCVLRAKDGDLIRVGMLGGKMGHARLLEHDRTVARLEVPVLTEPPPPPRNLVFMIALPRPQSFKKTLHFVTSCGIKEIVFMGTERVEKSYWKSAALQPDAIREELILGLEQGCDTILPNLHFHEKFHEFLPGDDFQRLTADSLNLIAHPGASAVECPRAVTGRCCVAIGPEGGFRPKEVEAFCGRGFQMVTFGPHILRVEFAVSMLTGRLS